MSDYAVHFTEVSRNRKIGPMPVTTTTRATCWSGCPLYNKGCYAKYGPLGMLWAKLSRARPGRWYKPVHNGKARALTWSMLCERIAALPLGTVWRHNQAGDLPGRDGAIDRRALRALVKANHGKHGFTYTHKPMTAANKRAIAHANASGFTINLSADNLREADQLAEYDIGPVVTILPNTIQGNVPVFTPTGRRVVVCPATYRDDTTCQDCQLCRRLRDAIVGFPAHGAADKTTSQVAMGA